MLKQFPIIRLLMPFLVGLVLVFYKDLNTSVFFYLGFSGLLLLVAFGASMISEKKISKYVFAICLNVFFVLLAVQLVYVYRATNYSSHFSNKTSQTHFKAILQQTPEEKDKSYKAEIKIVNVAGETSSGTCLVYFQKSQQVSSLKAFDEITFESVPQEIKHPNNPDQFDYANYLRVKNLYHQVYLKEGTWKQLPAQVSWSFARLTNSCREYIVTTISKTKIN